jgi:hypothetical protein
LNDILAHPWINPLGTKGLEGLLGPEKREERTYGKREAQSVGKREQTSLGRDVCFFYYLSFQIFKSIHLRTTLQEVSGEA